MFSYFAGSCKTNITCKCDTDEKEEDKPEKRAAIFAKEFQDKLYKTIFTKENDDKEPQTNKSAVLSTTPVTRYNHSNCSNDAQVRTLEVEAVRNKRTTGLILPFYHQTGSEMVHVWEYRGKE